jgi:hypothetical protein
MYVKKTGIVVIVLLVVAALAVFYHFSGQEYVFRVTQAQLQEKLDAKLPRTKTYLLIFQVTLDKPRVTLTHGSKRVGAGLDIILNIQVGNEAKPLGGTLDVSGGIRYAADKGEFFLDDPVIEHLTVQGIPDKYTQKVNSALIKALAEYYREHPIYVLIATDAKQAAARLVLKDVIVENNELVVTVGI